MAAIHADVLSVPAVAFRDLYDRIRPAGEAGKAALALLRNWDGQVRRDSAAPTLFATLRKHLVRRLLEPQLEPALLAEIFQAVDRGANGLLTRTWARLHDLIGRDDRSVLPEGASWAALMNVAFADTVAELSARLGGEPGAWRWGREHRTAAFHPLAPHVPGGEALNPPSIVMDGDGDTVQAASFFAAQDLKARFLSVARYIFDGADWNRSRWIVPGGASGHPGSPHYADQLPLYADHRSLPMTYDWETVAREAATTQTLRPA
jgi:penicillin amidase